MALLNTHATVKKFIKIGFKEAQAEAITEAINEQSNELATKSHLALVESNLKSEIAGLLHKVEGSKSELEAKIDRLETKMSGDIRSLGTDIKWIMAVLLAITGMLAKLTFFST